MPRASAALSLAACGAVGLAVLLVNGAGIDVLADLPDLEESHGMKGISFCEGRDSLSHIVQGRCQFFNPSAVAETEGVDPLWRQACGKGCKRASDLAHHLQTSHGRQLAMAFHRMNAEPFAPVVISDQILKDSDILHLFRHQCILCATKTRTSDMALHLREEHCCNHEMFLFYMEQLISVIFSMNPDAYKCDLCGLIFNLPLTMLPDEPLEDRTQLVLSHLRGSCPVLIQISLLLASILNGGPLSHGQRRAGGLCPGDAILRRSHPPAGSNPETAGESSAPQGTKTKRARRAGRGDAGKTPSTGGAGGQAADDSRQSGHPTRPGNSKSAQDGSIHLFFESRSKRSTASLGEGEGGLEEAAGRTEEPAHATEAASGPSADPDASNQCGETGGVPCDGPAPPHLRSAGHHPAGQELPIPQMGSETTEVGDRQADSNQLQAHVPPAGGIAGDVAEPGTGDEVSRVEACDNRDHLREPMEDAIAHAPGPSMGVAESTGPQLSVDDRQCQYETTFTGPNTSGEHAPDHAATEGPRKGQDEVQIIEGNQQLKHLTPELVLQLTSILSHLSLTNDRNWCYGNSVFYAMIWTLLSLQTPMADLWGPHFETLIDFLLQHASMAATLKDEKWFQSVVQNWGSQSAQQDSAEFAHRLLGWLQSSAFDMRWERRVAHEGTIEIQDHGLQCSPIMLAFSDSIARRDTCCMADLIKTWMQDTEGSRALLDAPACLCFQLDRIIVTDVGVHRNHCKLDLEQDFMIPIFHNHRLTCAQADYVVMAGISHFGLDQAGHCRAILRIQPCMVTEGNPAQWLISEDDREPEPVWQIPDSFKRNLVVLWAIRLDCVQQLPYRPNVSQGVQQLFEASSALAADENERFLQLLRAQTGVAADSEKSELCDE